MSKLLPFRWCARGSDAVRRAAEAAVHDLATMARPTPPWRVPFESLEGRRMLSVSTSFSAGGLTVTSDSAGDNIVVTQSSTTLTLTVGGTFHSSYNNVSTLTIEGNGGVDTIDMDDTTLSGINSIAVRGGDGNDTIWGSDLTESLDGQGGDDNVYGGGGDDHCYGGAGNDNIYGGIGSDQVYGGDGDDQLFIHDDGYFDTADGGNHIQGDTLHADTPPDDDYQNCENVTLY